MNEETIKKHNEALEKFYAEHGVGDKTEQKWNFWKSLHGNISFSHDPTLEQKVAMCELEWITSEFPQDATFC